MLESRPTACAARPPPARRRRSGSTATRVPRLDAADRGRRDRPVRARAARPVRPLAHEPAGAGRAAVGLAADAGARAAGVLRLPLEPDRLAVVLERRAGLVARANDVAGGRGALNFSEWSRPQDGAGDAVEAIAGGSMPPWYYKIQHPKAKLSAADQQALMRASPRPSATRLPSAAVSRSRAGLVSRRCGRSWLPARSSRFWRRRARRRCAGLLARPMKAIVHAWSEQAERRRQRRPRAPLQAAGRRRSRTTRSASTRTPQLAEYHSLLPCSGHITSIVVKGRFATAVFRLGDRKGSPCDSRGSVVAARFEIVGGKIVRWQQIPVPEKQKPFAPTRLRGAPSPIRPGGLVGDQAADVPAAGLEPLPEPDLAGDVLSATAGARRRCARSPPPARAATRSRRASRTSEPQDSSASRSSIVSRRRITRRLAVARRGRPPGRGTAL